MKRRMWGTLGSAVVMVALAGCGDDTTPGNTSDAADTTGTNDSSTPDSVDPTDTAPDTANDTGGDTSPDPDGTRYPIAAATGVIDGTFDERGNAAFDGQKDQTASSSASTEVYENIEEPPLLYKEFDCETRLRRVEIHPPSDSPLLYHPTNYPTGGNGTVTVVGRRADSNFWYQLSTRPFSSSDPVVFTPEDLQNASEYVAYGVRFTKDEPLIGTLQVAEVEFFGYCAGPTHEIAWQATPWLCQDVECVAASNPGGIERRTVTCARDAGGYAHDAFCEGEKPAIEGESCALACANSLVYVGPRPFTYDNGSGWLHEGAIDRRAGPLPSEVEFGKTVDDITGKPCSIPTTDARTYFVAISCVESQVEGEETQYCAFRCE